MYASHVCVFPYSLLSARCSQTSERTAHSSEMRTGEPASNNRQETTDTMGRAGKRNEKLRAASAHSDRSVYGVKTITDQCIGTVNDTTLAANHGGYNNIYSCLPSCSPPALDLSTLPNLLSRHPQHYFFGSNSASATVPSRIECLICPESHSDSANCGRPACKELSKRFTP